MFRSPVVRALPLLAAALGLSLGSPATEADEASLRLAEFTAHTGPVRLSGIEDRFDLFLPLAASVTTEEAVLDLRLTRSLALLDHRSSLNVRFNETTLAQIPYPPDQPVITAQVRIPAELWRPGFNRLTLAGIQHYADRCEDFTAPELWTELDLHRSHITYRVTPAQRPPTLRDLSGLFAPGIGAHDTVLLLTAPGENGEIPLRRRPAEGNAPVDTAAEAPPHLEALATVAQALALRRDYAPLAVEHGRWRSTWPDLEQSAPWAPETEPLHSAVYLTAVPVHPHVLVGTRDELSPILPQDLAEQIDGPFLHVDRTAALVDAEGRTVVPAAARLIVSGRDNAELIKAARLLAEMDDRFNPISTVRLLERDLPTGRPLSSTRFLQPGERYRFEALGLNDTTLSGTGTHRARVDLHVGPDFFAHESAQAELLLDFGYGAGMGTGSVMNLFLNGEYIHGLSLDQSGGAAFRDYRIRLPIRRLRPGINALEFEFTLRTPTEPGECRTIPGNHLVVQLLGSSRFTLPPAQAVAVQPDLALMSATAYPLITASHLRPTRLHATTEAVLPAALTFAGKLAQVAGAPSDRIEISVGPPDGLTGHAALFATPQTLTETLFDSWAVAVGRTVRWPYRTLNDLRESVRQRDLSLTHTRREPPLAGSITQDRGLGDLGVLLAMKNPASENPSTLTLLVADTSDLLNTRTRELTQPGLWSRIGGDLTIWNSDEEAMVSMRVGGAYEVGEPDRMGWILLTLSNNPWYLLAAFLAVALLLGSLAHRYLRARESAKASEP